MCRLLGFRVAIALGFASTTCSAFQTSFSSRNSVMNSQRRPPMLRMAVDVEVEEKGYVPKWKKKLTLAEQAELEGGGKFDYKDKGLVGSINVVFKQGNQTRTTVAIAGQPLSDVASQAAQFIKYGCKKGECGTCESMVNGKWIRPCVAVVPADLGPGEEYVVQVKEIKAKSTSSGKFYSVRSFFMGFYNNLLGMVGFVKTRRLAKKNFEERLEYEDLVARRTREKKEARIAAAKAAAEQPQTVDGNY